MNSANITSGAYQLWQHNNVSRLELSSILLGPIRWSSVPEQNNAGQIIASQIYKYQNLVAATRFEESKSARSVVEEFATLEENWDGNGASSISPETRNNALRFVGLIEAAPFTIPAPEMMPRPKSATLATVVSQRQVASIQFFLRGITIPWISGFWRSFRMPFRCLCTLRLLQKFAPKLLGTSCYPPEIADDEAIVRAICSPHHFKKNGRLDANAYWPPSDSDEISTMRADLIGADACKKHAKQLVNPAQSKVYKGLAVLSATQIRQSGAGLIDSRQIFKGHADIKHGIVLSKGNPPPAEKLKELRDRCKALADLANYLPDPDPAIRIWTGSPLRYKEKTNSSPQGCELP
jgi:hypothetical protein